MTDDGGIRASDADREHIVEILREAYSTGRLTLDEFDERTTLAFATKTWGGLRDLTRDLPQQARLEIPQPKPQIKPARDKPLPVSASPPRRRLSPMLPILVIWLGVALTAREPYAFIPVLVILFMLLRLATRPPRGNRPGPDQRPGDHDQGPGDGNGRRPD
ncbi:MAG: hypothetical protein JWL68_6168 [Actinomycetia bacterium]|nr:hypothetical protein [Actinomycetes bacterium]